jgi:SWI/SNF-related matrix-associated actin-dependent regulator 1 of chromatin subfamily A
LKFNWDVEIAKFLKNKSAVVFVKKAPSVEEMEAADYTIINYDILKKHKDILKKVKFDFISFDESHYLKNPKAQRTVAAFEIASGIKKKLMMSGTGIKSRPVEFFEQLNALRPDVYELSKFTNFAYRFCDPQVQYDRSGRKLGTDFSGASNTKELFNLISPFYIRREKTEVLKDLPEKVITQVPVELSAKVMREYGSIENNVKAGKKGDALKALNAMRHFLAQAKVDSAIEMIENTIANDQKIVVFSTYKAVIDALKEKFGDIAVTLTGSTSAKDRQSAVENFQNEFYLLTCLSLLVK